MKIKNLRWYIAGLLCLTAGLNYLDRQTLSFLIGTIQKDIHVSDDHYSNITSAFLVNYGIMYAVSGWVIDKLGTRKALLWFVSGWSLASMAHALARTAAQFTIFRFILGATEAANFPAGIKAVSEWFPMRERALAIGIFNAGTAIGACIAAPLIAWLGNAYGWRMAFLIIGALGAVWVVLWLFLYKTPREHSLLTKAELGIIESGQTAQESAPMKKIPIWQLLRMREAWGCIMARVLTDPISYFMAFWIPKFLQKERAFTLSDLGWYGGIPFAALALGNVAGGAIPNFLIRKCGWTLNTARKLTMGVSTALIPISLLLLINVQGQALSIALLSVAMFAHAAWANMTLPAEVFPKHVVATVSGFGGAVGSATGVITQKLIGWSVATSFTPVFIGCAIVYPIAFLVVCLLVRRLGEVREVKV